MQILWAGETFREHPTQGFMSATRRKDSAQGPTASEPQQEGKEEGTEV